MAENGGVQKAAENAVLKLTARIAIVLASLIGVPGAGWLITRAVSSIDDLTKAVEMVDHKVTKVEAKVGLIEQKVTDTVDAEKDHEIRLRHLEQPRVP